MREWERGRQGQQVRDIVSASEREVVREEARQFKMMALQLLLQVGILLLAAVRGEGAGKHPTGVGHHPPGVGGHAAVPKIANPSLKVTAAKQCSTTFMYIRVYTAADFRKRLTYSARQSVKLTVMNDVALADTLILSQGYSCTWIVNGKVGGVMLRYPGFDKVALIISDTHNILMKGVGVSINLNGQTFNTTTCPGYPQTQRQSMCAAIVIVRSYGIQITKAKVLGRVEMMSTAASTLDHLTIQAKGIRNFLPGAVTISFSGIGTLLKKAHNAVTNCDISGPDVGISMLYGAVGNLISNNYVHDFTLFGISCGYGVHSSGDCMLNNIRYNRVINRRKHIVRKGYTTDSAGIYFNLHWWGPGNTLTCNYVQGPGHCYYLDYATSGVTINGGMCISNDDGFKINTGKENKIKDVVLIKQRWQSGFVSCQNYDQNNCLTNPGAYWDNIRKMYFNTPLIRSTFPAWNDFCDQTTYNGLPCNPAGSATAEQTGKCSGIPTGNNMTLFTDIQNKKKQIPAGVRNCASTPVAGAMNWFREHHIGVSDYKFNSIIKQDYGIDDKSSYVYKLNPNFISCPARLVGIKFVPDSAYFAAYNINQPSFWEFAKTYKKP